jgi:tetratricopeptide (TPR) repeat protein
LGRALRIANRKPSPFGRSEAITMNQLFQRIQLRKSHRSSSSSIDVGGEEEKAVNLSSPSMIKSLGNHTNAGAVGKSSGAKGKVTHLNIKLGTSKPKQRRWKKSKNSQLALEKDPRAQDASFTEEEESVSRTESFKTVPISSKSHSVPLATPKRRTLPPTNAQLSNGSNRTSATRSTVSSSVSNVSRSISPEALVSFPSLNSSPSSNSAFSGSASSDSQATVPVDPVSTVEFSAHGNESTDDACFEVDYRGHYVVAKQPSEPQLDSVIQMALQASQKALISSGKMRFTEGPLPAPKPSSAPSGSGRKHRREREAASERLDESGNDLFEQGKLDQAFEMYEEALQLKRQSLLGQFNALQHQQACGAAATLPVSNDERSRILVSMATSINNLTYLRQVRGNMSAQETLEAYECSLFIKKEILGPEHISVAKTLSNIGSVYYLQQNFHEAAAFYEQARDILTHNLGSEHLDVCTVTSNLGDVHCSMKQWPRAVKEYRAALELRWKLLGPADPKVVRLMEQIAELEMEIDRNRYKSLSKEDGRKEKRNSASDRSKRYYRPVLTDLRKLQRELREDLESFNHLEKTWPVEMIKDKANLFRELRELKEDTDDNGPNDESQLDILLGDCPPRDDSSHATLSELLGDDLDATSPSSSNGSGSRSIVQVNVEEFRAEVPVMDDPLRAPSPIAAYLAPFDERVSAQNVWSTPVNTKTVWTSDTISSISQSPAPPNMIQTAPDSSFPRLSPDQRKQALQSVRDRLAELRANRESEPSAPSIPCSLPSFPILPVSRTVSAAPTSFLVKTSELLTMKQGIDALRTMPNGLPSSANQTPRHVQRKPRQREIVK